jgi:hypothetical protein
MKKLMILGALVGFSSGVALGLIQRLSWPEILWRSSIVCFAASFLFRWWGRVWLRSLHQAHSERLAARELHQAPPANV